MAGGNLRLGVGFHEIDAADYHNDAGEEPTLSSSIAKVILDKTPAHAFVAHPRLNLAFEADDDSKFDLGSAVHEMILGRGGGFEVLDFADYRTKAAQQARADVVAAGKTAILPERHLRATAMVNAVLDRLEDIPEAARLAEGAGQFVNGHAERVMIWRDIGGPLCRAMIDWHGPEPWEVWDLKTTAAGLSDEAIGRQIMNLGYDLSAAFYLRGLTTLLPEWAGRFRWRWIFVEDEPPHEVRVVAPSGEMLDIGDRKAALAIAKWNRCLSTGVWPGYAPTIARIEPPGWATARWMERELVDEDAVRFRPMSAPIPHETKELLGPC